MSGLTLSGPMGTEFVVPTRMLGRISLTEIKVKVCAHFKITPKEIESGWRNRRVARPRMMAMALSRELTNNSLPKIGNRYGGRDHTTVLHALRRVQQLRALDPMFNEDYHALKAQLVYQPSNDVEAA